jgi:hypothetical protein
VRGASALQDLLQKSPDPSLRVFVVWEPVIWSDLTPPLTSVLMHVSDRRAAQFWDRERMVSAGLLRVIKTGEDDAIVWDCVAIYPPGARWIVDPPEPAFNDCPVVEVIGEVGRRLSSPPAAAAR